MINSIFKLTEQTDEDILGGEIIGKTLDELTKYDLLRVVSIDGTTFPISAEFCPNRINVEIEGGLVKSYYLG